MPGPATAPRIFDRTLLRARMARAARSPVTFLLDRVADDCLDRLGAVLRTFAEGADIGTPNGVLAARLQDRATRMESVGFSGEAGETLALVPASIDLAVSALALHDVNDLPGALVQINRALKPDGLLMAALCG